MPTAVFDRKSMADWYARQHLKTDPGVVSIYFLRNNSLEHEIRLVEVNNLMVDRADHDFEPIDFGVDVGTKTEHKLYVLDVTPCQWKRIQSGELHLPMGWSLGNAKHYDNG